MTLYIIYELDNIELHFHGYTDDIEKAHNYINFMNNICKTECRTARFFWSEIFKMDL